MSNFFYKSINNATGEVTIEEFNDTSLVTADLVERGYKLDDSIHEKIWSHCASPIFLHVLKEIVEDPDVETDMEICVCREDEAGIFETMGWEGMGLFVQGTVTAMFTRDIASRREREDKGKRRFSIYDLPYLVDDYEKLVPSNEDLPYTETFIIPKKITGLWIKKDTKKKFDINYLKKYYDNLPIYYV